MTAPDEAGPTDETALGDRDRDRSTGHPTTRAPSSTTAAIGGSDPYPNSRARNDGTTAPTIAPAATALLDKPMAQPWPSRVNCAASMVPPM